jgi:putative hydrolase
VRAVLRGELTRLLGDPKRRATLDRLQATMSVVEGHAEHVMDASAAALGLELTELRRRLNARRERRGGLGDLLARLLGLDLKLRQYELGKAFCDGVAAEAGAEGLRLVWGPAADLPPVYELERPRAWLERVDRAPAVAGT